jgi:copper chaperone CopZ
MKAKFNVEGMMCAACSAAVERAVSKLDGVESTQVNLLAKLLTAEFDESKTDTAAIIEAERKPVSLQNILMKNLQKSLKPNLRKPG